MNQTQTILLPLDLEDDSSWCKILPTAVDFALQSGAQLHVMTVVPDPLIKANPAVAPQEEDDGQGLLEDADRRLQALLQQYRPNGHEIRQVVRRGSIPGEILRYARDRKVDLVIMAAHKPDDSGDISGPFFALLKSPRSDDPPIRQAMRRGGIYKEILRYARDTAADLVILSAEEPQRKARILRPNAAQIARHADCSVWVVRE